MLQYYFSNLTQGLSRSSISVQILRYKRKPRWIPTAPSKMFRIPPRVVMDKDEAAEWLRINQNYKTQINSLRRFLIQDVAARQQKVASDRPYAEDITDEIEINKRWNLEIAQMREKRINEVKEQRKEQILSSLERQKALKEKKLYNLKERVKKIEEDSKDFITRDGLDGLIDRALANPVSFDYCINSKGEKSSDLLSSLEAEK